MLNWAWTIHDGEHGEHNPDYDYWYEQIAWVINYDESPADAQRLWLDKILELAIEAGIVAVEE